MKKAYCLLMVFFIMMILVVGCNAEDMPFESPIPFTVPATNSDEALFDNLDIVALTAGLDQVLQENGQPPWFDIYYNERSQNYSFHCYDFDNITVYHSIADMGYNVIIYYDKLEKKWNVIDLGIDWYAYHNIEQIRIDHNDTNRLELLCESTYSDGGYSFKNYNSKIYYSISSRQIDEVVYEPSDGAYGMHNITADKHRFSDCRVQDNQVVFTFDLIPAESSYGLPGPEIVVNMNYLFNLGTSEYTFAFRNTDMNLSDDFLQQMRNMEGVGIVEVSYTESLVFTGTQLVIRPQSGYKVETIINQSGNTQIFEDFSVGCIPIDDGSSISETRWKLIGGIPNRVSN